MTTVRPFSPVYVAAQDMRAAVDRLAELLTGDATYFHNEESSQVGPSSLVDKLAREDRRLSWRGPASA